LHSVIDELEFTYICHDLYEIEDFSNEDVLIKTLSIGNKDFKLFAQARVEEMVGLQILIPNLELRSANERKLLLVDDANLRTLVNIIKKTKILKLNNTSQNVHKNLKSNSLNAPSGVLHNILTILTRNVSEFN